MVVHAVAGDAALVARLGLDPAQAALAHLDAPRWLGLARADVFLVDGAAPQVCELNCDTPTGLAECTELGRLAALDHPTLLDPSAGLLNRWRDMVLAPFGGRPVAVGMLDATEITDDLGHIRLLTRTLTEAGCAVVRGAPFNLVDFPGDRVGLFDQPCDLLIRHYKTDWWGARRSPWRQAPPPPDAVPLHRELALIARAMAAGTVVVANPWGAALAQSKRALALPWERPGLLPADVVAAALRHLPETRWLDALPPALLLAEQADWVLKSAFGCEGDEVVLGSAVDATTWRAAIDRADPTQWVAQRAFAPVRAADGSLANYGVYLIGGRPSGIYTRRSPVATDHRAWACPTLVAA